MKSKITSEQLLTLNSKQASFLWNYQYNYHLSNRDEKVFYSSSSHSCWLPILSIEEMIMLFHYQQVKFSLNYSDDITYLTLNKDGYEYSFDDRSLCDALFQGIKYIANSYDIII